MPSPDCSQCQRNTLGRLKAWRLEDLPKDCNTNDTFKLIVSLTYLQMVGHNKNPFSVLDDEDISAMQAIFGHIYQALEDYTITIGSNCPIFGVVYITYECYFILTIFV